MSPALPSPPSNNATTTSASGPTITAMNGTGTDHDTPALARARRLLRETPLIDGHNDFPFLLRQQLHHQIYKHDLRDNLACHTSLRKMRRGMMGGQFWSIYVPNPEEMRLVAPGSTNGNADASEHCCGCDHIVHSDQMNKSKASSGLGLNEPNHAVRDTLEQIDITHRLIAAYPDDLTLCTTASAVRSAHSRGLIASMLGIEGGHSTGNSIATLRQFFSLGVRYMTLTHNSDNAFGTSWISVDPQTLGGADPGLTKFGEHAVLEMNRLGMLVDLSHVSANTMRGALRVSRAPVIFSHSAAYAKTKLGRNVLDDVLEMVKRNGGVVMVPSVAPFLREGEPGVHWSKIQANVEDFLDHVVYIARFIGWEHVGLGSDFDGTTLVADGLEDTSKWPSMLARLIERENVTDEQVKGLLGENVLRVWEGAEKVARDMQDEGVLPSEEHWEGRIWEEESMEVPRIFANK